MRWMAALAGMAALARHRSVAPLKAWTVGLRCCMRLR